MKSDILRNKTSLWLISALYAALIFFLSSLPRPFPYIEEVEKYHTDWVLHGVEYGLLGFLLYRSLRFSLKGNPRQGLMVALAFLLCVFYAFTDEWHQSFVPSRDPSFLDGIADAAGAFTGIMIAVLRGKKYAIC